MAVSIMTAMAIGLFASRSDYTFLYEDEQVIVLGVSLLENCSD